MVGIDLNQGIEEVHKSGMNNLSPSELEKFNRNAHLWWDPTGPYWTLHRVNPLRLRFIEEVTPIEGKRIVDVGCGGGILSEALARRGAREVVGIDLAGDLLEVAKLHALDQGIEKVHYRKISVEELAEEEPEGFDLATCMEMLEHVPRPKRVVAACARLVRPGGFLFFSTLNRTLRAYLGAILAAEYLLGMIPKGTHQFEKFIKPSELVGWAREVELEPVAIRGIGYNPLSRSFFLTEDISINYLIAFRKPDGGGAPPQEEHPQGRHPDQLPEGAPERKSSRSTIALWRST